MRSFVNRQGCQSGEESSIFQNCRVASLVVFFPFNYMYIQLQWMAHGFFVFTSFFALFHTFTFFLVIASNHSLRPTLVEANMKTMSF